MGFLRSSSNFESKKGIRQLLGRIARSSQSPQSFPDVQQCITHLKLMRTFARLRHDLVGQLLQPSLLHSILGHVPDEERVEAETKLRNEIWHMYLDLAADRFEAWWKSLAQRDTTGEIRQIRLSTCVQPGKLESMLHDTEPCIWTEKHLPPIDVLMILHSFMLNPRAFLEDCIRYGMLGLWKVGMPWNLLDRVLDVSNNEYTIPASAQDQWKKVTGREWDIERDQLKRTIACPVCSTKLIYRSAIMGIRDQGWKLEDLGQHRTADCNKCDMKFDTDRLKMYKFRQAIQYLQRDGIPLPGTILSSNGLVPSSQKSSPASELIGINEQLQGTIADEILNLTSPDKIQSEHPPRTSEIHSLLKTKLNAKEHPLINRALQRAFLQFSDTHTMFALDLSAAVVRQGVFIDMMEQIDWLHSPSREHAITELLARYETFFKIMGHNKNNVAVPTYAVDLAWHTHQLSPASYYSYSVTNTEEVFIDHDDRIEEDVRTDAFGWTSEQYKLMTGGKDYGQCLCWYCTTACQVASRSCYELTRGGDGHVNVKAGSRLEEQVLAKIAAQQYQKLEEDYRVICQLAIKSQQPAPGQKQYLQSYTWLYPRAVPVIGS